LNWFIEFSTFPFSIALPPATSSTETVTISVTALPAFNDTLPIAQQTHGHLNPNQPQPQLNHPAANVQQHQPEVNQRRNGNVTHTANQQNGQVTIIVPVKLNGNYYRN
jgi:hypothetical protein